MSIKKKYLKIYKLVKNLENIKKQIKINHNNKLFIDYLLSKWTTDFSNLSFKQSAEISMYKEKCSTTSSSTMLEKISVEPILIFEDIEFEECGDEICYDDENCYANNRYSIQLLDTTTEIIKITAKFKIIREIIKITAKFKDGIEVTCEIYCKRVGNQPFTKPNCEITLLNHNRKNQKK